MIHRSSAVRSTDADTQPRNLLRKAPDHRVEPVMASPSTPDPHPEFSEGQPEVIHHDQDILDLDIEGFRDLADDRTREIDEGERLQKRRLDSANRDSRPLGIPETLFPEFAAEPGRHAVHRIEADVVPGPLVLLAGVADADDQLQSLSSFFSVSTSGSVPASASSPSSGSSSSA